MVDLRCKRRPAYVHAPSTIRDVLEPLIAFNPRERDTLCLHARSLAGQPEARVRKCIQYANDPGKTWFVYQVAISHLLNMINPTTMDDNDIDCTIELFKILRYYTFEVPIDNLILVFSTGVFGNQVINDKTRKTILSIAGKIAKGITPRKSWKGDHWEDGIIDDWLEQAR